MTFTQRNREELIWIALNTAAALMNLWFAVWSNIWWLHVVCFVAHAVIVGLYVAWIFENRELDALEARVGALLLDLEAAQGVNYEMTAYGRRADGTLGPMSHEEYADLTTTDDPYLANEVRRVLNGEVSQ